MEPKELILRWVECFNEHDAKRLSDLYHDDAISLQVAIGTPLIGKAAILKDLQEFFTYTPDSYTKLENILADGNRVALEWFGGGTFSANPSLPGKSYTLSGCGFFIVEEGKIKAQRGYWDKATWFGQVGLSLE